jgi:hypothetical protein
MRCEEEDSEEFPSGMGSKRARAREHSRRYNTLREDMQTWEFQSVFTLTPFTGQGITL